MADILLDNQTAPTTPAASKSVIWVDSTTKKSAQTDDGGHHWGILSRNNTTASQGAGFSADTYITNSGLLVPSFGMQAGQLYNWIITASKTGAGTATPIVTFRIGTNQTTADTAINTITGEAASATIAGGHIWCSLHVRSVSATGVTVAAFGFDWGIASPGGGLDNVGATFDNTARAGQYVGLSLNAGASAAWTISSVFAELVG